jgi:hypothetical protein
MQIEIDLRFFGGAFDDRAPLAQLCAPFVDAPFALTRFSIGSDG